MFFVDVYNLCKTPLESYGDGDEEKRLCGLSLLDKQETECLVYSLGSNNQWGFEEAIYKSTSCRIETFDCTVDSSVLPPSYISDRVRLHRVCLGKRDYKIGDRQYLSYSSIHKLVGAAIQPTVVKMDIEGYEYEVLRSIVDSGNSDMLPLQIALEIHQHILATDWKRTKSTGELLSFMNYLHLFGGYHLIDRNDNPFCLHCSEILLARLDCKGNSATDYTNMHFKHGLFKSGSLLRKQTHPTMKKALDRFYKSEKM